MAQKLNVFGNYITKISESIAELSVQHRPDGSMPFEPVLYLDYTRNGDAHTGYLQFKAHDSDYVAATGISGEGSWFDVVEPNPVPATIATIDGKAVPGNVLQKMTFGLPSGEAISHSVCTVPVPKNITCDAMRVVYYSPTSGELTMFAAMN